MKFNKNHLLLYAVTDRSWTKDRTLLSQVKNALEGGITFLQLREKELDDEHFLQEAKEMKILCKQYNVPFVINDNIEIAIKSNADGVHIGQDDMDVAKARALLGKDKIVGVTAHNVEEATYAEKNGADYLGVGAAFHTSTKDDADTIDHGELKKICESVNIPVVAIGGINKDNIMKLSNIGVCGVSVVSAIFAEDCIKTATEHLRKISEEMVNGNS